MPKYRKEFRSERIQIPVREDVLAEIDDYVLSSGMYRTYFFTAAFILGARILAQVFTPGRLGLQSIVDEELQRLQTNLKHESVSATKDQVAL